MNLSVGDLVMFKRGVEKGSGIRPHEDQDGCVWRVAGSDFEQERMVLKPICKHGRYLWPFGWWARENSLILVRPAGTRTRRDARARRPK